MRIICGPFACVVCWPHSKCGNSDCSVRQWFSTFMQLRYVELNTTFAPQEAIRIMRLSRNYSRINAKTPALLQINDTALKPKPTQKCTIWSLMPLDDIERCCKCFMAVCKH